MSNLWIVKLMTGLGCIASFTLLVTSYDEVGFFGDNTVYSEEYRCPLCLCGSGAETRVVGGTSASPTHHPWLVALTNMNTGRIFCSSTLISDFYALTAAHCVRNMRANRIMALMVDTNRLISKIISHQNFGERMKYNNDIALLKFNKPIDFRTSLSIPACLPRPDEDDGNKMGIVVGWGKTSEDQKKPSMMLNEAVVPILEHSRCKMLEEYKNITENMICAGYYYGGIDACQGDSGGPLMVEEYNRQTITGIVSWGIGCGRPMKPGVYTKVNKYTNWVISRTMDSCFCY